MDFFIFCFTGISFLFFIFYLSNLIFNNIFQKGKKWEYFSHIFILDETNKKEMLQIYTLNNPNYRNDIKYLRGPLKKCRQYSLDYELKINNYSKFDVEIINKCHCDIIQKIMINKEKECLIVQNMSKPRDYYELVAYLLVNNINSVITILSIEYNNVFFMEDFTIKNILKSGSHIFYSKNNKKYEIIMRYILENNEKILVGEIEDVSNIKFSVEIKNKYFHIKLYEINKRVRYGVSIIQDNIGLTELDYFYIGQFYKL